MFYLASFFQHLIWLPIRAFMYLCCNASIQGLENVKHTKGGVIFASNHVSQIDPLFIVSSLPYFSTKIPIAYVVAEKEVYENTWHGWRKYLYGGVFFWMIGGYEAYSGLQNYDKALVHHIDALNKGKSVCIFPVGRRHDDTEISLAKGGVSYLAKISNSPVIPIRITGLQKKSTLKDFLLRKNRLVLTFGEPLAPKDIFTDKALAHKYSYGKDYDIAAIKIMEHIVKL